jgi:hypothetical protein
VADAWRDDKCEAMDAGLPGAVLWLLLAPALDCGRDNCVTVSIGGGAKDAVVSSSEAE